MLPKICVSYSIIIITVIMCLLSSIKSVSSQEYVILRINLNEEDHGEVFCVMQPGQDIWLKKEDLARMKLKDDIGEEISFNGEAHVPLRSISGLEYFINEDEVSLEITAEANLFKGQDIDVRYRKSSKVKTTGTGSAFFNYYGMYVNEQDETYLDVSGELGISTGDFFGRSTFSYLKTDDEDKALRLESSLTMNDREGLWTAIFGDFSAASGPLGSGMLLGGVNISRNFSIDPYFISFPSLDMRGSLETPSEVEVYLDGLLVKREHLSPGEFVFHDVPATVGLGTAQMIINDAYGRESIITTPYYYSERLLKRGLHEYSYSVGFMRKYYGEKSFSYGDGAFLATHTYGYSRDLTIGYSAEASNIGINIGPTVSMVLSKFGVANAALAVSESGGKHGLSGLVGYSFTSRYINARLQVLASSEEYSNIILKPSDDKEKKQLDLSVGYAGGKKGSFTAAYSLSDFYMHESTSRIMISYNKTISKRSTLFINAMEIKDNETNHEILMGLHVYFGEGVSGNVLYTGREDEDIKRVSVQKSLPVGNGVGYRAVAENTRDRINYGGDIQYQHDYGTYEIGYADRMDRDIYRLSAAGGIGYIDNSVFLSRPILDSYAKVKVGGLEDVRTYYYGNEVGKTNSKGEIIVPNLHSFYENKIDINATDIPLDYSIPSLSKYISPSYRSGSIIHFDVKRIQGIMGTLFYQDNGEEIPVESAIMIIDTGAGTVEGLVGTEGEYYMENAPRGTHPVNVKFGNKECQFNIVIPDSKETLIDMGKAVCEVGK